MPEPTKTEKLVLQHMMGIQHSTWTRYPTLAEVREAVVVAESLGNLDPSRLAWLRAAERRMTAGATSPFEARSEAEEVEHG